MPVAIVTKVSGPVMVRVRRACRDELLYNPPQPGQLKVGDRVQVVRTTNNPFPKFVGMEK
jgi:hypothetical protein